MKKRTVFFQIKLLVIVILSLFVYSPEMFFFQISFDLKIYVKCWILRYTVDVRENALNDSIFYPNVPRIYTYATNSESPLQFRDYFINSKLRKYTL